MARALRSALGVPSPVRNFPSCAAPHHDRLSTPSGPSVRSAEELAAIAEQAEPIVRTYKSAVADIYAEAGYTDFAELVEAGYGCSACHLTHELNRIPTNAELDLTRFDSVARGVRSARMGVEMASTAFIGALSTIETTLGRSALRIRTRNALDPLDALSARAVGEEIASNPVARRAYAQLQARGTDVFLEFGSVSAAAPQGYANRNLNFVVVNMQTHRTVEEAVSTFVHEASHIHRHFRGSATSQLDEVRAFAREFVYEHGRRPTLAERRVIWADVVRNYSHLPKE